MPSQAAIDAIALDLAAINPAPAVSSPGLAARCAERFRAWRRKRRWVRELKDAQALGRLDEVLDDIGITRAEMDELMAAPADAGRQFEVMAKLEGVDLAQVDAGALREATWKCVRCDSRAPCKRWMRTGLWSYGGDPRCPNARLWRH